MRYLLTVILVLALAAPAWSKCSSTARELLDVNDTDTPMPVYSNQYLIGTCNTFNWTFDLTFTSGYGQTIAEAWVLGSNVHVEVDSEDQSGPDRVLNSGSGEFSDVDLYYRLKIDVSGTTGHWTDMDLRVFDQSE